MNIKYITKNYKPSVKFKDLLEKKIEKLDKYFDSDVTVKVNLEEQANLFRLEITINAKGAYFRSDVVSDNMFSNIDIALPKIERQVIKHGSKFASKLRKDAFVHDALMFLEEKPAASKSKIVKTKKFELVPTTVEDAEAQMDALGHNFYVFLNVETNKVNVVYKRNDNNCGLIELDY